MEEANMPCNNPTQAKQTNQKNRINVTELTPSQRRQLFKDAMNQTGFTGFVKHQDRQGKQTHYNFTYANSQTSGT